VSYGQQKYSLVRAIAVCAVLAAVTLFGVATAASAHNFIVSTTPAEGETLTTLPERFDVTTNDSLLDVTGDANAFVFDIIDEGGLYYGDGCVTVEGPSMMADAALGPAGTYTIAYQFVSADGHTVSGEYSFEWAPENGEQLSTGWDTPAVCGEEREGVEEPAATESPEPSAEPSADPTQGEEPEKPVAVSIADELLWVGGAVAAIVVAIAVTMLLLRRR